MDVTESAGARVMPRVNLHSVVAGIRRRLPLFLIIFATVLAIAAVYSFTQRPTYEAIARVLVDPRPHAIVPVPNVVGDLPQKDANLVDTEVEVLESRNLAERVVRRLNLTQNPEFGENLTGAVNELLDRVNIRRVGETYLIDIAIEDGDPGLAAQIANSLATNYIELQRETKRAATVAASNVLRESLLRMADQVRSADAAVQAFRIANNLMSVNGTTLAEQTAASIDQDLALARAQEAEARGRVGSLQGSGGTLDAANAQTSLGALRAEQASAQQALSEATLRYGERHPNYQAALGRVRDIDEAIAAETVRARAAVAAERQRQINQARAEAAAAVQRRASLSASSGETRGALTRNTRAVVELNELERRAEAERATYTAYLNRYKETQTQLGTEQADSRIIAHAAQPNHPVKPNHKVNLALGGAVGIAMGLAIILLAATLDPRLSTPDQIEADFDVNALPSIASLESIEDVPATWAATRHPVEYILAEPLSAFAEQFRNLRAAIEGANAREDCQVLAITSALPGEGKTTTALCVATVAALSGLKTVIVDCDLRHRAVSKYAGFAPSNGLAELLSGEGSLSDARKTDERSGLDYIVFSEKPTAARDYFGTDAMGDMVDRLSRDYDLVVLDTPPVLPIADTRLLVRHADTVVVLVKWRHTPAKALEGALAILGATSVDIAGVSLTQVDLRKQSRQGYGDPTFYYRKYKSYYKTEVPQD